MKLTHEEIKDRLKTIPEIDLLEVLDIDAEQIVDRFEDKIAERLEYFIEDIEDGWEG